jgi:hypothetical protein
MVLAHRPELCRNYMKLKEHLLNYSISWIMKKSLYIYMFYDCEIYHCHYTILGYHSKTLLIINMLHECKLWVLIIFWCGYMKCGALHRGDCACYSREIMLLSSMTYHLIAHTTGKEFWRKQGNESLNNKQWDFCGILNLSYTTNLAPPPFFILHY